jgi:hypothetical protein
MRISFNSHIRGLITAVTLALVVGGAVAAAPELPQSQSGPPANNEPPDCIIKHDQNSLSAPPRPTFFHPIEALAYLLAADADVFRVVITFPDTACKQPVKVPEDDFWAQVTSSADLITGAIVSGETPPPPGPLKGDRSVRVPATDSGVLFVVSLGDSSINSDQALFVAAAKPTKKPANLDWKRYRIQLTDVADGGHFCTPSANAFVLPPKVGVSPAGRLFVTFDSFEGSTTTGSILDFDIASLLNGGPARVKCFTGTEFAGLAPPHVRDDNANAYFLGVRNLAAVKRYKLKVARHVNIDTVTATPDIDIPFFNFNPAAVQPNGFHLFSGGFGFNLPSIQIGNALWNVHQIGDDGGHAKVRLYKFATAATNPKMMLTLSTLPDQSDDLFAPSLEIDGTDAFMTFTRTIPHDPANGKATLMMARGPNSSSAGWTSKVLVASPGQFSKDSFGSPCDPADNAGCQYGPNSATVIDPVNSLVWGFGEIITNGSLGIGGKGNEVNWVIKGVGVPR